MTEHLKKLQDRYKKDKKKWIVEVTNNIVQDDKKAVVKTYFNSDSDEIENVIHKVHLDVLTNLHFGFTEPTQIIIKELE